MVFPWTFLHPLSSSFPPHSQTTYWVPGASGNEEATLPALG